MYTEKEGDVQIYLKTFQYPAYACEIGSVRIQADTFLQR